MSFFKKPTIESLTTYLVLAAVLLTMSGLGYFFFGGLLSLPLVGREGEGVFKVPALALASGKIDFTHTDENEGEDLIIHADKRVYEGDGESEVFLALTPMNKQKENIRMQFLFPQDGATASGVKLREANSWQDLPIVREAVAESHKKPISAEYAPVGYVKFETTGGTQYFSMLITYPPGISGEFWIEAFGDRGSYGLLDPVYIAKARSGSALGWYNSSWGYRKKITVDPNKVGAGGLTNFPMLFSRIDPDLKVTGSGGRVASSTAGDIVFTDWDNNKIDHEIEKYTSTTGELLAWVEVPFVSSTSTRSIYMYYGNSSATYQPTNESTWDSNYAMVMHLVESSGAATTGLILDSTSNNNDGTRRGINEPIPATAYFNGGQNWDGFDDRIDVPDANSLDITGALTLSGWVKFDSIPSSGAAFCPRLIQRATSAGGPFYLAICSPDKLNFRLVFGGLSNDTNGSTPLATDKWYYLVATRTGTSGIVYLNGAQDGTATVSASSIDTTTSAMNLGESQDNGDGAVDGLMDELRISNTNRSAAWVQTEYNNQSSPAGFYGVGGEDVRVRTTPTIKGR